MKRFLSLLFISFSLSIFAQEKVLKIPVGFQGGFLKDVEAFSFINKQRNKVCFLVREKGRVKGYVLDSLHTIKKDFEVKLSMKKPEFRGGFFVGDKLRFLFTSANGSGKKDQRTASYVVDLNSGVLEEEPMTFNYSNEQFVSAFSVGDQFLHVTINKNNWVLNIYSFEKEKGFDKLSFDVGSQFPPPGVFLNSLMDTDPYQSIDVSYVNDWEETPVETAQHFNKIYFRNDSLFIIQEKTMSSTAVLSVDLKKSEIGLRSITRTPVSGKYPDGATNSILFKNYLFNVTVCSEGIQLAVHDFYAGNVLKTYTVGDQEEITFKNTPIIQEGGGTYYSPAERKLGKTKQLLRKMLKGKAVIAVQAVNDSTLELTVGSYKEISGGGGGVWMPTGGSGAFGAPAPKMFVSTGFSRGGWTKSARFKTLLSANTMEKVEGEPAKSVADRIESYTKGISISSEGVYPMNANKYYYYYDSTALSLVISKL